MLSVTNLDKYLGGRALLEQVSFQCNPGEAVALVGANGSGKSTLLKICAGLLTADGGQMAKPKDATIGYLPQHAELESDRSLQDELRQVFAEALAHEQEMHELAHQMGELKPGSDEYDRVMDRYGHLHHELDRLHAFEMDANIGRIAAGLGFANADLTRSCREFSGGWRMRVLLAKLLLNNPDIMLLDEPTNHLDLETMIWLEEWIRASDATVMMVSHERAFMDNLAKRVYELHEGRLTIYRGNYSDYLETRKERWEQWTRAYTNQKEEIEKTQRFIDRFRYQAAKAVQVQSRVKQLEKVVRIPTPPSEPGAIHFRFPDPDRGSHEAFAAEGLGIRFGDLQVLQAVDLAIWRGERVALVGLNGAGKSTLMKLMIGRLQPTEGTLRQGKLTTTEYFAQYENESLGMNNTVLGEVASVAPTGSEQYVRNVLGGFYFSGDDLDKRIHVLSGGERTRVRLAKMLFAGANTLLLDEPTNHLDLASRRTLEDAMRAFPGTLIFVSHDRVFLERVPTRILEIKDGRVRSFDGNYDDYCRALATMGEESPLVGKSSAKPHSSAQPKRPAAEAWNGDAEDDGRAISREERKEQQKRQRQHQRNAEKIEQELGGLQRELKDIQQQFMLPDVYTNPAKSAKLGTAQRDLEQRIARLEEQWMTVQEAMTDTAC